VYSKLTFAALIKMFVKLVCASHSLSGGQWQALLFFCLAGGRYKPPEKQIDVETEATVSKYIAGLLRPMYKAQKLKKEHYKVHSSTLLNTTSAAVVR